MFVVVVSISVGIRRYNRYKCCVLNMSSSEEDARLCVDSSAKKRHKFGIVREVFRKLRNTTYKIGPDCKCKWYRCFKILL